MRLLVVGSSDAFHAGGRGHSCYWLEGAAERPMMIDFGATALLGVRRAGLDPRALGAVVVTHLHGDHFAGLPFLLLDGVYNDLRADSLDLVGPFGFRERLSALSRAAYGDLDLETTPYPVKVREILPGAEVDVLGARVRAFAASHMDPPDRPLCLRVTGRDGKVVAFSGDTEFREGLLEAADGADLLVAECTGMRPPKGRHSTWEIDWARSLDRVRARRVILTHLGDDVRDSLPALRASLGPGSRLDFADDGLVVEI